MLHNNNNMDLTDENLKVLAEYLQNSLNYDFNVRRAAENFLKSVEANKNYPLLLLQLVNKQEVDMVIRVAGAITFKNFIKEHWEISEDKPNKIHEDDRNAVKQLIVELMLRSPSNLQKIFSEAVSIIGKYDFPNKWPQLIDQMVEKFRTGDFNQIRGVLVTTHSLFKKYRYMFKSNELWLEIKHVLEKMAQPLTDLLRDTMALAQTHANNAEALEVIYRSLLLICKVFYSLNFQDLPEFFEDNMQFWMQNFHALLVVKVDLLITENEQDPDLPDEIRSQICDNITLYALQYDEEFTPYVPTFVTAVWELLVSTDQKSKHDMLVSKSLTFLSTVAEKNSFRHLFQEPTVLNVICEKVIIPNMEFRTYDEEMFKDNPEEYIRRDIEGSDVGTRRRAACDLVNALKTNFESRVTEIFGQYIQVMLSKHAENPSQNWRSKDAALYLVTTLASKGQTQRHGVTQTNQLVSIPQFGEQHVIPELIRPNVDELPVLKADAIKYLITFRSVVPGSLLDASMMYLIKHLGSEFAVVHSYAACAIEKILTVRGSDNQPAVKPAHLVSLAGDLLTGLFATMEKAGSEENDYCMKAVMRSIVCLQEHCVPYLSVIFPKLIVKLQIVCKNPSKPHFNHFLFETISLAITMACKSDGDAVSSFEELLFPIFEPILQQNIEEFIPYVFQVISLMISLSAHKSSSDGTIAEPYMRLLPCLISPVLWEKPAMITSLVGLLRMFIVYGHKQMPDKISGFLGIFQKLIASKSNDHEGFLLIQTMMSDMPKESLLPFHKDIFFLLFQRLSSSKTTKFVRCLIVFFCFYICKFTAEQFVNIVDTIQAQMTGMVLEKIIIPNVQKVSGTAERKIAAVGITKLLCECPAFVSGVYQKFWGPLLECLVCFFELPQDDTMFADDHYVEVDDAPTIEQTYSKLNYAKGHDFNPIQGIQDPRSYLATKLGELSAAHPNVVAGMVATIGADHQVALKGYLGQYNVHIV